MSELQQRLSEIRQRITTACDYAGRESEAVKLLLATKTVSADRIKLALQEGETLLGENKVQELKAKFSALQELPYESHFIGHLQSNKVKEVLKYVSCIQSLDRLSLAQKLQNRLEFESRTIDVFLQVNTSGEASKFGVAPQQALAFARQVQAFDRLRIKGVMTIGLLSNTSARVRQCFRTLKTIQLQLLDTGIEAHEVSMGMSKDLEIAIEEGATIVRVGTAIFGERCYPDSYYWNEQQ